MTANQILFGFSLVLILAVSPQLAARVGRLVQLLIGVLFVLVAASVSPLEVGSVMPEAIALLAVMVLLVRPAAVALATLRSSYTRSERAFVAWMAPRGPDTPGR